MSIIAALPDYITGNKNVKHWQCVDITDNLLADNKRSAVPTIISSGNKMA